MIGTDVKIGKAYVSGQQRDDSEKTVENEKDLENYVNVVLGDGILTSVWHNKQATIQFLKDLLPFRLSPELVKAVDALASKTDLKELGVHLKWMEQKQESPQSMARALELTKSYLTQFNSAFRFTFNSNLNNCQGAAKDFLWSVLLSNSAEERSEERAKNYILFVSDCLQNPGLKVFYLLGTHQLSNELKQALKKISAHIEGRYENRLNNLIEHFFKSGLSMETVSKILLAASELCDTCTSGYDQLVSVIQFLGIMDSTYINKNFANTVLDLIKDTYGGDGDYQRNELLLRLQKSETGVSIAKLFILASQIRKEKSCDFIVVVKALLKFPPEKRTFEFFTSGSPSLNEFLREQHLADRLVGQFNLSREDTYQIFELSNKSQNLQLNAYDCLKYLSLFPASLREKSFALFPHIGGSADLLRNFSHVTLSTVINFLSEHPELSVPLLQFIERIPEQEKKKVVLTFSKDNSKDEQSATSEKLGGSPFRVCLTKAEEREAHPLMLLPQTSHFTAPSSLDDRAAVMLDRIVNSLRYSKTRNEENIKLFSDKFILLQNGLCVSNYSNRFINHIAILYAEDVEQVVIVVNLLFEHLQNRFPSLLNDESWRTTIKGSNKHEQESLRSLRHILSQRAEVQNAGAIPVLSEILSLIPAKTRTREFVDACSHLFYLARFRDEMMLDQFFDTKHVLVKEDFASAIRLTAQVFKNEDPKESYQAYHCFTYTFKILSLLSYQEQTIELAKACHTIVSVPERESYRSIPEELYLECLSRKLSGIEGVHIAQYVIGKAFEKNPSGRYVGNAAYGLSGSVKV